MAAFWLIFRKNIVCLVGSLCIGGCFVFSVAACPVVPSVQSQHGTFVSHPAAHESASGPAIPSLSAPEVSIDLNEFDFLDIKLNLSLKQEVLGNTKQIPPHGDCLH